MKRTLLLLLSLVLWFMLATAQTPPPDKVIGEAVNLDTPPPSELLFTGCTRVNVAPMNDSYEQRVVELTNIERNKLGIPPLKRNTDLDYAGRYHSKDMMDENYFNHDSYDGGTLVCSWSSRISNFYSGWSALGENIAAGFASPEAVVEGWMNSEGHRANILNSNYREIGVGYTYGGGYYYRYWTQDFGKRSNVYPIVINLEAAQTDFPDVNLYIYGKGTWNEMRLRNDSGTWTAWMPFQERLNGWSLPWTAGTHTVSVELRNGSTSTSASDTIYLTTNGSRLGNLPDSIAFVYEKSTGKLYPDSVSVQPTNSLGSAPLTWSASTSPSSNFLQLSRTSGTTPGDTMLVTPHSATLQNVGTTQGTLSITVTNPPEGSSKSIPVRITVVNSLTYRVFLPAVIR
ncbi:MULTISPECIES: CAP domain-containing protein [Anaerolinea]|uniref:CAP domain-containing protein n=1 Tax=Anaerolinea TaxID=233189 RepID=UPI00262C75D7|nr:CAP domain-containing protein [Anaerolinea thermophila]